MPPTPPFASERRADIDHLRVGALLLLILYHVLLIYNSADWWRVKSVHAGEWAADLVTALTPWRMALVFFIGGVAARFMFERGGVRAFVRDRTVKLMTAFVFAVIVIVPLQRYVRLDEEGIAWHTGYLSYLLHGAPYVQDYHHVWLPDFAHAWFLPYLLIYSLLIAALWRYAPALLGHAQDMLARTPLPLIVAAVMAWFVFVEVLLLPRHPVSGIVFTDYAAHAKYLPVFCLGALVAKSGAFRARVVAARYLLWPLAAILFAACLTAHFAKFDPLSQQIIRGLYGAEMLFAAFAFGEWALGKPTRFTAYATDAILPVYLMHQTVLVVVADNVTPHQWPLPLEFATLVIATGAIPLAIYHVVVRRTPLLRALFGLRAAARDEAPAPPPIDALPAPPRNSA